MSALKRIRKGQGYYTQESLAKTIGVDVYTISKYERGYQTKKSNRYAIAYVLHCKVTDLFDENGVVKE